MRPSFIYFILVLSFFTSSVSCLGRQDIDSLILLINQHIVEKNIPGAMVSIVTADSTIFVGGVGYANLSKSEIVTDEHLFRQGSISKSFTALALLKLLDQKNIDLSTPLKQVDKEILFQNKWKNENPVTIENLLEHTAGFDDFHLHAIYNTKDSIAPPVSEMVSSHRNSLITRWKPGERKAYSNPGYIVIGQLLESLSGQKYSQYIEEEILQPLSMEQSGFYFTRPEEVPMAQGYKYNGKDHKEVAFTSIQGGPAGEFCSNAIEMANYLTFMLNRNGELIDSLIFDDQKFDRIETSKTTLAAKQGLPYGYGLGNYSIWKNGYLFHGHSGGIDGFSSRYVYSRKANIGVAVSINREGNANALIDEILAFLIGEIDKGKLDREVLDIPEDVRAKYEGFYEFRSPRNKLFAFSERMLAGLILDFDEEYVVTRSILGKPRDTLFYAGDLQFYQNSEEIPSTIFLDLEDGKTAFWINENYTERASRTLRLIKFFGLLISFLVSFAFIVYCFVYLVMRLFSKKKRDLKNHLILFGFGFNFILMFVAFAMVNNDMQSAGNLNFNSILFFISSIAMVLFAGASMFSWRFLSKKRAFRNFYILSSISAIILSVYFFSIGFVGLRLWAY